MRVIIVGCGKVGSTLAKQLSQEGHEISIIDRKAAILEKMSSRLDVIGIIGNATSSQIQEEAGVKKADLLIAVTTQDEVNLMCCLIAKKIGNCHTIARVRNPDYLRELNIIQEELGLSMIINPEQASAQEIARLIRFPSAIQIETFAKGRVELLRLAVPNDSSILGHTLHEVDSLTHSHILVCIVERDGRSLIPDGNFVVEKGDRITAIVPPRESRRFLQSLGIPYSRIRRIMIIGGGTAGYFLAHTLVDAGIHVKIIEKDHQKCELLAEKLPQAAIIEGDGTDRQLLIEEGIMDMDCVVNMTGIDEENVMLSLFTTSSTHAKAITRVDRLSYEDIIENLPVGSIISPRKITASTISQYVRAMHNSGDSNVETIHEISGAEALEFRVKETFPYLGLSLNRLKLKSALLIGCINRNGRIIIPSGQDVLEVNDTVIVVTTRSGINDLKDIFE